MSSKKRVHFSSPALAGQALCDRAPFQAARGDLIDQAQVREALPGEVTCRRCLRLLARKGLASPPVERGEDQEEEDFE